MTLLKLDFGFLPNPLDITIGGIAVNSLENLPTLIDGYTTWAGVEKDWIYPGMRQERNFSGIRDLPYANRVFGLPKTHSISHSHADSDQHLQFIVWCIGFFLGMRLTTTEAGFLDATPIRQGKLVDFLCDRKSLKAGIQIAEEFWQKNRSKPEQSKRLIAAIHALFIAHYPQNLEFERFIYLYTSLDACFVLLKDLTATRTHISHAKRIEWMCQHFSMTVPDWASDTGSGVMIAGLRNSTIHEALFADEPLGFAVRTTSMKPNMNLEMEAMICRLLVGILGGEDKEYIRSAIDTRNRYSLDLA